MKDSDSSSLIEPSSVTVVRAVDDQGMLQSPGLNSSVEKKKKQVSSKDIPKAQTSKPPKSSSEKPSKSSGEQNYRETMRGI